MLTTVTTIEGLLRPELSLIELPSRFLSTDTRSLASLISFVANEISGAVRLCVPTVEGVGGEA